MTKKNICIHGIAEANMNVYQFLSLRAERSNLRALQFTVNCSVLSFFFIDSYDVGWFDEYIEKPEKMDFEY